MFPPGIIIESDEPIPLEEGEDISVITSAAAELLAEKIEQLRQEIREEASDLCKTAAETPLLPLRVINHTIPIIDEKKQYSKRGSRVSEALKPQWLDKLKSYVKTGRWKPATGHNTTPMLLIPKRSKGKVKLRTAFDLWERNANTRKLASPLPDIEEILNKVTWHKYRSLIDGKDAYEQIRVEPEDIKKTLFTSPSGTMESEVMQIGDCNAGATYQTLMQAVFSEYIGDFMYVYLDNIIVFSETIQEHVEHIRKVLQVLRKQKLYLSPKKMQLFAEEPKILGHIINRYGIKMDPEKVDTIENWKVPTSKDLLMSYIGAVGYLAPNCPGIRIPMGVLTKRASQVPWQWTQTDQRTFEETKKIVSTWRNNHRVALNYADDAPRIRLVTDASHTGASGFVCQGDSLDSAKVVQFWSGKFAPAQQNYAVHEKELLAIVESLKRFRYLLHGAKFVIMTDHEALKFLSTQKNLSPRQARWLDVLNEFDFEIEYIPGETNVFADALSRIYANNDANTVRKPSEYVEEDDVPVLQTSVGRVVPQASNEGREPTEGFEPVGLGDPNPGPGPRRSTRECRVTKPYEAPTKPAKPKTAKERGAKRTAEPGKRKPGRPRKVQEVEQAQTVAPEAAQTESVEGEPDEQQQTHAQTEVEDPDASEEPLYKAFADAMLGPDVEETIKGKYESDAFFGTIIRDPSGFPNFMIEEGLIKLNDRGRTLLCIPDVIEKGRSMRERIIEHAHTLLAHMAHKRTYTFLRESVWWKGMSKDINDYCAACTECAGAKSSTTAPYGKLKLLTVPNRPWQVMGFDMVGPLPLSKDRNAEYDMVGVAVDLLTMMTHLIPMRQTYTARELAEMIFDHVYKLHGLPEAIVSDRDSLFTSQFWTALHKLTGTKLKMLSAYHPQTDGTVERTNRTWVSLLWTCIDATQKNWVSKLPGIEFAINSARFGGNRSIPILPELRGDAQANDMAG
ncbi:hypothetical protein FRC09_017514 [Ceratobasidium sp. 395]|nr:hypothetical protein FRC09_017514 [Ceratobasidium sp. 395]